MVEDFFRPFLVWQNRILAMRKENITHFIKNALLKILIRTMENLMALKPLTMLGNPHCLWDL